MFVIGRKPSQAFSNHTQAIADLGISRNHTLFRCARAPPERGASRASAESQTASTAEEESRRGRQATQRDNAAVASIGMPIWIPTNTTM